jgi:hypothetical protein
MIDALFGSKTRVKLLHLFLNNPGQPFYVREITRKINEQINSVRRELSNMIEIGIITSDSSENKLYYQINQRYEYYLALKSIFGNSSKESGVEPTPVAIGTAAEIYGSVLQSITSISLAIFAGVLVRDSSTAVDVLLVGSMTPAKLSTFIKNIEKGEGREINYSILTYDEFYYRLSIRDKFITEILNNKHVVVLDRDKVLNK